jgi:hypothetical protein
MDQIVLIYQMYYICIRCIRAGEYYYALIDSKEDPLWANSSSFYAEIVITRWCQLFGSHEEKTSYTKLFGVDDDENLKWLNEDFSLQALRKRLVDSINSTPEDYDEFRLKMIEFRNSYVSHWDAEQEGVLFPDLYKAIRMCQEYGAILKDVSHACAQKLKDIEDIISINEGDLMARIEDEKAHLINAVNQTGKKESSVTDDRLPKVKL